MDDSLNDELARKKFDVEHALIIKPRDCLIMPANYLYDVGWLKQHDDIIPKSHVYLIGYMPEIQFIGLKGTDGDQLIVSYLVGGQQRELRWSVLVGSQIVKKDGRSWLRSAEGKNYLPTNIHEAPVRLDKEQNAIFFNVLYVGQAYGNSGSRNALERLQSHEKMQQIALTGRVPKHHTLSVLLLELEVSPELATMFNPHAKNQDPSVERLKNGLNKLSDTTQAEKTTLYEACLIRYFQPQFNKEFKNSFPSTNMKLLASCYEKDIAAIIACLDINTFQVCSDLIPQKEMHWIQYDLHSAEDRSVFFNL